MHEPKASARTTSIAQHDARRRAACARRPRSSGPAATPWRAPPSAQQRDHAVQREPAWPRDVRRPAHGRRHQRLPAASVAARRTSRRRRRRSAADSAAATTAARGLERGATAAPRPRPSQNQPDPRIGQPAPAWPTASARSRCRRAAARSPRRATPRTSPSEARNSHMPTSAARSARSRRRRSARSRRLLLVAVRAAPHHRRRDEVPGRRRRARRPLERRGPPRVVGRARRGGRSTMFQRNSSWNSPSATAAHVMCAFQASVGWASAYCRPASYSRRFTPISPIRNIGRNTAFITRTSPTKWTQAEPFVRAAGR